MTKLDKEFDVVNSSVTGKFALEASAGTGKTYSLIQIVLRLVVEESIPIDRILLITFTNAATNELKSRIRAVFSELVERVQKYGFDTSEPLFAKWVESGVSDKALALMKEALSKLDEARIYTIHSFCSRMLKEFVFTSGFSFAMTQGNCNNITTRVVDEFVREEIVGRANELVSELIKEKNIDLLKRTSEEILKNSQATPVKFFLANSGGQFDDEITQFWEKFIELVPERVKREKLEEKLMSTDDLLTFMNKAADSSDFIESVSGCFDAVMVDEFQDTDPIQFEIISKCFLSEKIRDHIKALFIVGDPKQSIYRFRGADLDSYLKAVELIESLGGEKLSLRRNYRSAPALVECINAIFGDKCASSSRASAFLDEAIKYRDVFFSEKKLPLFRLDKANQISLIPSFEIWTQDEMGSEKGEITSVFKGIEEIRALEAYKIAEDISSLINSGAMYFDKKKGQAQKVSLASFAILVNKRNSLEKITEALSARGIKYEQIGKNSVLETEEGKEIATILKVFESPTDKSSQLLARATRIYGENLQELLSGDEKAIEAVEIFKKANEIRLRQGITASFNYLFSKRKTYERLVNLALGPRHLINYDHTLEILEKQSKTRKSLSGLIEWMQKERTFEEETGIRKLASEDAVKIVTIHSSKGLEYPIVYLPGLSSYTRAIDGPNCLKSCMKTQVESLYVSNAPFRTKDYEESFNDVLQRETAERVRLLYVALTRASSRLVLPFYAKLPKPKKGVSPSFEKATRDSYVYKVLCRDQIASRNEVFNYLKSFRLLLSEPTQNPDYIGLTRFEAIVKSTEEAVSALMPEVRFAQKPQISDICKIDLERVASVEGRKVTKLEGQKQSLVGVELGQANSENYKESWVQSSFSSIAMSVEAKLIEQDSLKDDEKDETEESKVMNLAETSQRKDKNDAIFDFPRGPQAGTALHAVLEKIELSEINISDFALEKKVSDILHSYRFMFGQDFSDSWDYHVEAVAQCLRNIANCEVSSGLKFKDINPSNAKHEMEFLLKVVGNNSTLSLKKFGQSLVKLDKNLFAGLANLKEKDIAGYLTGIMDYVFELDGKYWVVDWKSNFITDKAQDYNEKQMMEKMTHSNYWLQGFIYLAALRKFVGKDNIDKIGGAKFVFIRGVRGNSKTGVVTIDMRDEKMKKIADTVSDLLGNS